jgi:hypothetical protein
MIPVGVRTIIYSSLCAVSRPSRPWLRHLGSQLRFSPKETDVDLGCFSLEAFPLEGFSFHLAMSDNDSNDSRQVRDHVMACLVESRLACSSVGETAITLAFSGPLNYDVTFSVAPGTRQLIYATDVNTTPAFSLNGDCTAGTPLPVGLLTCTTTSNFRVQQETDRMSCAAMMVADFNCSRDGGDSCAELDVTVRLEARV